MTARPRKCLHCQKEFESTGPGNRICPDCKKDSSYRKAVRKTPSRLTVTNGKRLDSDPNGSDNQ